MLNIAIIGKKGSQVGISFFKLYLFLWAFRRPTTTGKSRWNFPHLAYFASWLDSTGLRVGIYI